MNSKKPINVKKITVLGQEYLVRATDTYDMDKIAKYVNMKMEDVIKSGMDVSTQQLRIAVFACLEISGELFLYKDNKKKIISELENTSQRIIESIDEKISQSE